MNNATTINGPAKTDIKVTYECPRCCGKGEIPAFRGIWNETCFKCSGTGRVSCKPRKAKPIAPMTDYQIKMVDVILNGDHGMMTYAELLELDGISCWPVPQYPTLRELWSAGGRKFFIEAQEIELQNMYANRGW